jgi:hypothetical protein
MTVPGLIFSALIIDPAAPGHFSQPGKNLLSLFRQRIATVLLM